jgi:hypothetical protein
MQASTKPLLRTVMEAIKCPYYSLPSRHLPRHYNLPLWGNQTALTITLHALIIASYGGLYLAIIIDRYGFINLPLL